MKRIKSIVLAVFFISLLCSFTAFAQEGLGARKYTETERVWVYIQEDGSKLVNEWRYVNDYWYYFDGEGVSKQNIWAEINGKWYYFDNFSRMLHDTTTPDGYIVGSDGAWIQE